jgi:hypothetical protein
MPPPRARGVGDVDLMWFSEMVGRARESAKGLRKDIVMDHSLLQHRHWASRGAKMLFQRGHGDGRDCSQARGVDVQACLKLQVQSAYIIARERPLPNQDFRASHPVKLRLSESCLSV